MSVLSTLLRQVPMWRTRRKRLAAKMARGQLVFPDQTSLGGAEHFDPAFVAGYDRKQGHPGAADLPSPG